MTTTEILQLVIAFEESNIGNTEKDFAQWVYDKNFFNKPKPYIEKDRLISYLIQRIARLGRIYGKKALSGTELGNIDEFTIINTVYNNNGISKNKLYTETVFELSTGSQIIKRLVENNLICEKINPEDKRVTNLYITKKGEAQRNLAFEQLSKETSFKVSMFDKKEKELLCEYLTKMNEVLSIHFHPKFK
jgi:DNA-binding MarR family transcriptional regulator